MSVDYDSTRRYLLGLAEAAVTANGNRATFVSDMYFEAAEAIETLIVENTTLKAELFAARARLFSYGVSTITRDPLAHIKGGKVT